MTEDRTDTEDTPQKPDRTVTVTGLPLLLTGLAAFLGLKKLKRRRQRRRNAAA